MIVMATHPYPVREIARQAGVSESTVDRVLNARAVVRAAARAKRERVAERCRQARAASETRDRSSSFAKDGELTRRARLALPSAIERRWRDPATRREWCRAALAVASRRLVGRDWTSAVAMEVSTAERDELVATAAGLGASLTWSAEAPPALGLRIVAGGACVDATLDGLLADAAAVEARVLAVLRGLASRAGEP